MYNEDRIDAIMDYWFGDLKTADLPAKDRTLLWFGAHPDADKDIKEKFYADWEDAVAGKLDAWEETPRGCLALLILLDQFSRNIFRGQKEAFEQDKKALDLCLSGIKHGHDHRLTLLQRVFFYMPMEHAESITMQEKSVIAYQSLHDLSMEEVSHIYQNFLKYAVMHYELIRQFGRFPHRNIILGRHSSEAETLFLAQTHD